MLTGPRIIDCVNLGHIVIDPFDEAFVNPNSVDLRLGFELSEVITPIEDPQKPSEVITFDIPKDGFTLLPHKLYLATTIERTQCADYVPCLHGKSSLARRGLSVHQTAGFGDHGFNGNWTLELMAAIPIIIRPGMRICQVSFTPIIGQPSPYVGRYQNQIGITRSRGHWASPDGVANRTDSVTRKIKINDRAKPILLALSDEERHAVLLAASSFSVVDRNGKVTLVSQDHSPIYYRDGVQDTCGVHVSPDWYVLLDVTECKHIEIADIIHTETLKHFEPIDLGTGEILRLGKVEDV